MDEQRTRNFADSRPLALLGVKREHIIAIYNISIGAFSGMGSDERLARARRRLHVRSCTDGWLSALPYLLGLTVGEDSAAHLEITNLSCA